MRQLLTLFCIVYGITGHAQYFDTLHVRYAIGEAVLQQADQTTLDSLVQYIGDRKLLIYSYADYLGSEKPNQHLSDKRAQGVKDYLLGKGVKPEQVMECTGLGKVAGTGGTEGNPDNRRTDIFIRKDKGAALKPAVVAPPQMPRPMKPGVEISAPEERKGPPKITVIDVDSLQVNDAIRMEHINFYAGEDRVLPGSYQEVENLYRILSDNPTLKIRLEGHVCCCVYPDGYFEDTPTWGLSVARARTIYRYLVDRGIKQERMQYKGFGRTRPVYDEELTDGQRIVNRRVEIRILAK